ncbi:protein THEM6-like [Nylanderia fulva]|uniref:protein THEM6-like n=1 Tax=Nylanderia fulva TaxID=613905 RepID=UPI0010FBADD2|nr:protein THEM6-like [Nylanderia fulva]
MFLLYFYCMAIIAILYAMFDVNYFLKFSILIIWARLFKKKRKLLDTTTFYGICTTKDIDIVLKHKNNARYLRDLDFARYYYYDRTGLYKAIVKRGGNIIQTACNIRYRRAIPIFMLYKITTKLIYWEDKHFYMEQQFTDLKNNFIYAIILNRQTITGSKTPIQEIIANTEPQICIPKPTKEFQLWLQSIIESSQNLKKQN